MSERGGTEDLSSPPNGPASGSKKPITEMDRDELVAKCKGLLQIAQKAKVAKDDAAKKLEKQTEKTLVLEEMVQALTEQKLSSVQANDLLRKHSEKAQLELKEALQAKDNLKTELVGKDRQIHRITGGNEDLLKQMDDLKNQLKSQVATTQDALQQISSLKDKLHHLKGENEKLNMEHEEFEDLKREHEELKEKLMVQASKPSTSIQDQEIQELNEVIYELKSSQKSSDEEIEQLKQALREEVEKSSREHSNSRLEAQENLYEYVEEITSLKLELKSLQPKQKELDERNEELQQAKEKVKKLETEQKNNAEKYKVINTALTKKHAELEEMATQLVEAKAKAGSAEKCLQEFKLMVEKSEDKIKELQHELELNKQSSDTTETEFSALAEKKDSEVRELKTQSEQGKNRIKELEDILEHKTTELDNLKENLEKLKSEQQNVNEHHAKIEEYNEKISNLEERLGQNFNEINRLQESLNEKQHIIDDLEAAKQELSGELETKSAMLADLDGKEVYINELKAQLLSFNEAKGNEALMLASELEQNNTKIKTLESSLEVSETTISSLREEMKTLETLQTEKETLSETNEYLKWELKAKSEQTLELQQRNQHQINELRNQVEELSRTVLDKTELIKMLSEEKEKLEKDLYEVNEKEIEENHELRALQDRYQNENVIHQKAIASLQDECSNLKKELESQVKTCSESQKIIDDKNVLVAKMAQDCDEVNKNEQIIQNLNNQIASLQQIQITNNKEMESKDQYIANLKAQLEEAKGKNFSLMENLKNTLQNIKELAMEFQRFKDDAGHMIRKGQDEMAAFANKKEMEFVTLKQCLVKELSEAESRNTDLIDEMNQMNMEIKKRGEKLSIVESQCETMQQEIDAKSKELFESMKTIQDLNEKIADLNPDKTQSDAIRAISTLTNEVEALKATKVSLEGKVKAMNQKLAQEEVQSEAMSTSTISKVEENSRMADIENSFEERYSKLKILAIKLKKKSLEQENKIKELIQNGKGGLEKEKIASLTQNYAKLQEQNDEQGDLIDEQKSTIFNLKKEVEKSTSEITELKDKLGTLEATLEATKSQKDALFIELDQVKNDLTTKEEVIKAQEMTLKDLTEKHDILSKANQQLNSNLAKFSSDDKRTDLLDMELETAERRIEELTQLSQGLEVKIQAMEQEKKREDDLKKTRDTLVEDLETSLQKETERADEFKSKLSEARACVSRLEVTLSEVRGENQCLQQRVNDFASTNEKINNQLNDLTGNAASNSQALTKRNDALQKMVNILEADIDRKKKNLTEAEDKIATLTKEYESYKIRAASVLRQSKESENQSGSKSQEVVSLERLVQSLNEKINELSKKMATSEMESQHLQEDHDRLMERHSALLQEMAAKELASRHKHEQLVILANQSEKAKQDLEIKAQNQAEALKQTFRSQIEDLQSAHSTEISKFQKQIDDLENQNILLEMAINKAKTTSNIPNQARVGSPNSQLPQVHMKTGQKLHVNLLEREAAEGSETEVLRRSSASPRNASDGRGGPTGPQSPIPLDQLLSQGDEEESSYHKGRASSITNAYVDNFESRIASAEKRVKHMTSLLSESEAENARLVQMSEVLKEEIRRYQRSEERKKHIENLEYVKNVILKFITLPGNEEKIRLVPVLTTILKLSPKEIETLQKTIQAEIEESSPQEVGWSTYLGLWSQ